MARNSKREKEKTLSDKIILYTAIGITILSVIVISLFLYSKKLNDDVQNSTMTLEEMSKITDSIEDETESVSTEIGKNVDESKKEEEENVIDLTNTLTNSNTTTNTNTNNTVNTVVSSNNTTENTNNEKKEEKTQTNTENSSELSFERPVEGEIMREYAKDNLIYSETLQEWTTHTGIDIKAEKTTVVKSAEAGTVKSIKNDPRYGLTIVIEHNNQYQSIYSNLLTSEFVVEGEKVEKGQSLGTVGNTAPFEIADEPHLHFEIWKDSLPVDPTTLIK